MSGSLSLEQISAVIDAKRAVHPELARPLTWPGLERICMRERIRLRVSPEPMPRPAQLIPFLGRWAILLSRAVPYRRHTYLAAHELGHLWLHHDRGHERWERVYNMDSNWADDPREDDAEVFASLVLLGPRSSRPFIPEAETHVQHALRTMRRVPRGPR
jgi:hypothetical protein